MEKERNWPTRSNVMALRIEQEIAGDNSKWLTQSSH